MKIIFTFFVFLLTAAVAQPQVSNHVVISQVYGGGGNSGAPYANDFIELFNPTNAAKSVEGWTIKYASATGTTWNNSVTLTGSIQPYSYYLVALASGGAVGSALPTANVTGTTNLSATAGKLALLNANTALTGNCPIADPTIVDFVGFGTTADCYEGTGPTAAPSNTNAVFRIYNGCIDANNNASDFTVAPPAPRNSSSPTNNCGTLPLNLTSLQSSFNGKATQLSWSTVNESNMKGFSVERSANGLTYTQLTFVNANNSASAKYNFQDQYPLAGTNYYRLKLISNDGSVKYSTVVIVSNKSILKATIFPNPAVVNLTVTHTKAEMGATIKIISLEGKQIKTSPTQVGAVQTSLSVSELVKGNYLLVFESNGQKSVTPFSKQ
jgi:hypothetical protein